jgi:6-phosphogluconolactonase (cycloisomerase 2 family)
LHHPLLSRAPDGTITEAGRIFTGGAGSGNFKPVSGQENAPNAFEGAKSVILTPDRRFLFATNGGDNSVSSFTVGVDGKLTIMPCEPQAVQVWRVRARRLRHRC